MSVPKPYPRFRDLHILLEENGVFVEVVEKWRVDRPNEFASRKELLASGSAVLLEQTRTGRVYRLAGPDEPYTVCRWNTDGDWSEEGLIQTAGDPSFPEGAGNAHRAGALKESEERSFGKTG